jgi:acyl carrier protein
LVLERIGHDSLDEGHARRRRRSRVVDLVQPDDDMDFAELDLDSLAAMEMCLEIEDKTGIEIDLGDLAQHPSVNALAKFMVARAPADAP